MSNFVRIPGNYHWASHKHRLQELNDHGLVYGQDYTWGYYPKTDSSWDADANLVAGSDSYTEIEFQDPALATYYQLRWS